MINDWLEMIPLSEIDEKTKFKIDNPRLSY